MTKVLIITLIIVVALLVLAMCVLVGLIESFDRGDFCETNCPYKGNCKPLSKILGYKYHQYK